MIYYEIRNEEEKINRMIEILKKLWLFIFNLLDKINIFLLLYFNDIFIKFVIIN